jgi:DHA2 family multidrug resistance protein-like MFS transporter
MSTSTAAGGGPAGDAVPLHDQPHIRHRRWFLLAVMCLSLVMVVMSVSGLNVALPSLQRSLDTGATDLQWIVDSYAIVFAGLLLSAGAIGDRFGRKLALMAGLAVFAGGSLIGALADTSTMVIVSRAISGVGAAFIMPATLSLISAVFPPAERPKAIAVWAGFAGAGGALGPLLVGFLLTDWWIFPAYWWGSAFVVNTAAAVAVLVVVAFFAPRSRDDAATPLDPVGAVLSLVGVGALLFGIIEGPERGWGDAWVAGGFVLAAVALGAFVAWELRGAEHPMLPMQFFRDARFSTGSGIITFGFLVMFGFFFLMTQYFQFVRGYSPLKAGIATLPFAVTMVTVSPRSAGFVERFGMNRVVAAGFGSLSLGFVVLAWMGPSTPYLVIVVGLVLLAAGMATSIAPATGAIMSSIPLSKAGVGSAVNDTTREFGGALGIAVLGSIVTSSYRDSFAAPELPPPLGEAAGESIGAAYGVAARLGGPEAGALIDRAGVAFTDAVNGAFATSAVIAVLVGVVVYVVGARTDIDTAVPDASHGHPVGHGGADA